MTVTAGQLMFDAQTWSGSGFKVMGAGDSLATAVNTLCGALEDAGAGWGQDNIGLGFFNGDGASKPGFGQSRDEVLQYLSQMVNLLRQTGAAMVLTGRQYGAAEQASTIGAAAPATPTAPPVTTYKLPQTASHLVQTDPPPGAVMHVLGLLEDLVAGCQWPDGNMVALGSLRQALSDAAQAVDGVKSDVAGYCNLVEQNSEGKGATEFSSFVAKLSGPKGELQWLKEACQGLSGSVNTLIEQKNAARDQFVAALVFLAASFLAADALGPITFGGSIGAWFAEAEAEGQVLRLMLQAVLRGVIEGLWYGGGMDLIHQFAQMGNGLQGFSWTEFGKSLGEGAVAGGVAGGASFGLSKAGLPTAITTAASKGPVGKVLGLAADGPSATFLSKTITGGIAGTLGNAAAQATFDGGKVNMDQAAGFGFGFGALGAALDGNGEPGAGGMAPPTDGVPSGKPDIGSGPDDIPSGKDGPPAGPGDLANGAEGPPSGEPVNQGGDQLASVDIGKHTLNTDQGPASSSQTSPNHEPVSNSTHSGTVRTALASDPTGGAHAEPTAASTDSTAGIRADTNSTTVVTRTDANGSTADIGGTHAETGGTADTSGAAHTDANGTSTAGGTDTVRTDTSATHTDASSTDTSGNRTDTSTATTRTDASSTDTSGNRTDTTRTDASSTDPTRTDPTATKSGDTTPTHTRSGDTDPTATKSGDTTPTHTRSGDTDPTNAKAGDTTPTHTRSGDTDPTNAKAGDTPANGTAGDPKGGGPGDTVPVVTGAGMGKGTDGGLGGGGHSGGGGNRGDASTGTAGGSRGKYGTGSGDGADTGRNNFLNKQTPTGDLFKPPDLIVRPADLTKFGAEGAKADSILNRYGTTVRYKAGGGSYYDPVLNRITIDPNNGDPGLGLVHEANHAEWANQGWSADRSEPDRNGYVNARIGEEAEGEARAVRANLAAKQSGLSMPDHPFERVYEAGYHQGTQLLEQRASLEGFPVDDAARASWGEFYGRQAIADQFISGNVRTSTTGESYPDFYGRDWDAVHPGGMGQPQGNMHATIPDEHPQPASGDSARTHAGGQNDPATLAHNDDGSLSRGSTGGVARGRHASSAEPDSGSDDPTSPLRATGRIRAGTSSDDGLMKHPEDTARGMPAGPDDDTIPARVKGWMQSAINRTVGGSGDIRPDPAGPDGEWHPAAYSVLGAGTVPPISAPPGSSPDLSVPGDGFSPVPVMPTPSPTLTPPSVPAGSLPGGDVPGPAMPGTSLPGTSLPGTSLPGTAMPGTSVPPGTSMPGTNVPAGTSVPGTSVPGTSTPGGVSASGPAGAVPAPQLPGSPGGTIPGGGAVPGGGVAGIPAIPGFSGSLPGTSGSGQGPGTEGDPTSFGTSGNGAGSGAAGRSGGEAFPFPYGGMGGFGGAGARDSGGRTRASWESENREIWDPEGEDMPALGADGIIGDAGAPAPAVRRADSYSPRGRFADGAWSPGTEGRRTGAHEGTFPFAEGERAGSGGSSQRRDWQDDEWAPEGRSGPTQARNH